MLNFEFFWKSLFNIYKLFNFFDWVYFLKKAS